MPHSIGRYFVRAYYRYSPPMADFIAGHDTLRMMVRLGLLPLIGLSWMLLHLGAVPTLFLICLISSAVWVCYEKTGNEERGWKAEGQNIRKGEDQAIRKRIEKRGMRFAAIG